MHMPHTNQKWRKLTYIISIEQYTTLFAMALREVEQLAHLNLKITDKRLIQHDEGIAYRIHRDLRCFGVLPVGADLVGPDCRMALALIDQLIGYNSRFANI
jgi:hypothetical protein